MRDSTAVQIADFIYKKSVTPADFQRWLFSSGLETDERESDLYDFLLQQDYRSTESRYLIKEFVENDKTRIATIHRAKVLHLLEAGITKQKDPALIINDLYDWATYGGYTFLAEIEVIANFNEQGKSVALHFSNAMTAGEKWSILGRLHPDFEQALRNLMSRIGQQEIVFLGEYEDVIYGGRIFSFRLN